MSDPTTATTAAATGYTEEDVQLVADAIVGADCAHGAVGPGHVGCVLACSACVAQRVLTVLAAAGRLRPSGADRFRPGDRAAFRMRSFFSVGREHPDERVEGSVIRVADDGLVTVQVLQDSSMSPMEITAPAAEFAKVEDRSRGCLREAYAAALGVSPWAPVPNVDGSGVGTTDATSNAGGEGRA